MEKQQVMNLQDAPTDEEVIDFFGPLKESQNTEEVY